MAQQAGFAHFNRTITGIQRYDL